MPVSIKTPQFWYQPAGFISALLSPVAALYQVGHHINTTIKKGAAYHAALPVICVGNAIAGGGGKTPTVIALVKLLKQTGIYKAPYILTRGYGGKNTAQPTLIDINKHTAQETGDEPLLLARHAPTVACADRTQGAKFIEKQPDADIIIMDDGLFNPSLNHDLRLLVIDRALDFGNGKTIPAGPLREPLKRLLPRIDAVLTIGPELRATCPSFQADIIANTNQIDTTKSAIAFAGIGRPEKFITTLKDAGVNIINWYSFPDHHNYTAQQIATLKTEAAEKDAILITTEKDFVRINNTERTDITPLPIDLAIKQPDKIINFIAQHIKNKIRKTAPLNTPDKIT